MNNDTDHPVHAQSLPQPPGLDDEEERLAALHGLGLLQGPPSAAFDRITELAARVLDVPIALVSLVDETCQSFKSRVGIDATETAREIAFCAHAVLNRKLLNVPDATCDIRFAHNPLVTGPPYIRAYIGAPLYSREGYAIGTLCAIDTQPREFNAQDILSLNQFANILEESIQAQELAEASKTVLHLATRREQLFRDTFEMAAVGIVHTSLNAKLLRINQQACAMLGYSESELASLSFLEITHAHDVPKNLQFFQQMIDGQLDSYQLEKRFIRKDGSLLWAKVSVSLMRTSRGQPDYLIAVIEDIAARKALELEIQDLQNGLHGDVSRQRQTLQAQHVEIDRVYAELRVQVTRTLDAEQALRSTAHRLREIGEYIPIKIGYWNRDLRCEFANTPYQELFGLDRAQLMGERFDTALGPTGFKKAEPHVRMVLAGHPQSFERRQRRADGSESFIEVQYIPDFDDTLIPRGFFVFATDITESRTARLALEAAAAKLALEIATDSLTGLATRRVFTERLEEADRHFKATNESYAVVLLDLDGFRDLNEAYGHQAADEVLRSVGRILKNQLRSHRDVAARLDGDEFGVLCFGDLDEELTRLLVERLRSQLNAEVVRHELTILRFTASYGLSINDATDPLGKNVYARADAALLEAKALGRDHVSFH